MKCPLRYERRFDEDGDIIQSQADCLKEECAWWVDKDNECALRCIGGWLVGLVATIDRIAEKMPHEGQFRR